MSLWTRAKCALDEMYCANEKQMVRVFVRAFDHWRRFHNKSLSCSPVWFECVARVINMKSGKLLSWVGQFELMCVCGHGKNMQTTHKMHPNDLSESSSAFSRERKKHWFMMISSTLYFITMDRKSHTDAFQYHQNSATSFTPDGIIDAGVVCNEQKQFEWQKFGK